MEWKEWFDSRNAFVCRVTTATMIEAIRKGYGKVGAETTLDTECASSLARHGGRQVLTARTLLALCRKVANPDIIHP